MREERERLVVAAIEASPESRGASVHFIVERTRLEESAVRSALSKLVKAGRICRKVEKLYETTSTASRAFGGVVTMRRKRAFYTICNSGSI